MKISTILRGSLLTTLCGIGLQAFAEIPNPIPSADELPVFDQFNEAIVIPAVSDREIYQFTPTANGVMTVFQPEQYLGEFFIYNQYDESDYSGMYGLMRSNSDVEMTEQGYNCEYNLTAGVRYFIGLNGSPLYKMAAGGTVYFVWAPEEGDAKTGSITEVFPAPSAEPFDYNIYQEILVFSDFGFGTMGEATFSYGDETIVLGSQYAFLNNAGQGRMIQLRVAFMGYDNLVKQAIEAGAESFTITITDVTSNGLPLAADATDNEYITVDNGTLTMTYPISPVPEYLPSESTWPSTFYSFWNQGNPDGIATLVFSQPIASVGNAVVTMAQVGPGFSTGDKEIYSYTLEPVIDGNKVILDFTGVQRDDYTSTVTVIVQSVIGENGLTATLGEYGAALYEYIPYSSESSAVSTIETENAPKAVYNLQGVKVDANNISSGIYIVNGKKVIVK